MYIRVPVPSSMAVTNGLGLFGLVAVVIAIGLLAGVAWALLAAGVLGVALSVLAQTAAAKGGALVDLDARRAGRAA